MKNRGNGASMIPVRFSLSIKPVNRIRRLYASSGIDIEMNKNSSDIHKYTGYAAILAGVMGPLCEYKCIKWGEAAKEIRINDKIMVDVVFGWKVDFILKKA